MHFFHVPNTFDKHYITCRSTSHLNQEASSTEIVAGSEPKMNKLKQTGRKQILQICTVA